MTKKDQVRLLSAIFDVGISGASENCYAVVSKCLEQSPKGGKTLIVTLDALQIALKKASTKWDKAIDKELGE